MKFANIKVGDAVFVRQWNRHVHGYTKIVTKVVERSKGFYIGDDRYDMATGCQTNYNKQYSQSQQQCWRDEQEYLDAVRNVAIRQRFRQHVYNNQALSTLSIERLQELALEITGKPLELPQ
jgi:hypothetical protein